MSINEFYLTSIRPLPPGERLRLASLILDELAVNVGSTLDIQDSWSDEDTADLAAYAMSHAERSGDSEDENA